METKKLIEDISLYLELYPPLEKDIACVPAIVIPNEVRASILGVCAAEEQGNESDWALLKSVISRCSDDVLDALLSEYGEDSPLGQMIRQLRVERNQTHKTMNDVEIIQEDLEKVIDRSKKIDTPFYDAVCKYIDKQGYKSDADFYNAIGMPRQLFARLRDPMASLSKKTAFWIIIGLKLDYIEASDLLNLAGFTFKKNEKRDIILSYILRNTEYNLFGVNEILDHFGVEPLC